MRSLRPFRFDGYVCAGVLQDNFDDRRSSRGVSESASFVCVSEALQNTICRIEASFSPCRAVVSASCVYNKHDGTGEMLHTEGCELD